MDTLYNTNHKFNLTDIYIEHCFLVNRDCIYFLNLQGKFRKTLDISRHTHTHTQQTQVKEEIANVEFLQL